LRGTARQYFPFCLCFSEKKVFLKTYFSDVVYLHGFRGNNSSTFGVKGSNFVVKGSSIGREFSKGREKNFHP
jgi:hypothetical protein